jgi:medium-chain acyl-[acyl-carrier-protein] hydrolase
MKITKRFGLLKKFSLLLIICFFIYGFANAENDSTVVANAGEDMIVKTDSPVTLDGSGSSIGGDFAGWHILDAPDNSHARLDNPIGFTPSFTPDVPGRYTILLVVFSWETGVSFDQMTVTAVLPNQCMYRPDPQENPDYRIFCFPYAGYGPHEIYDSWRQVLPDNVELVGIMFPGRSYRSDEEPFTRLYDMVNEVYNDIEPLLDVPYVFFGHCMGALIEFEVAHHLENAGKRAPFHLYTAGTPAPHLPIYNERPTYHDASDDLFIAFLLQVGLIDEEMAENKEEYEDLFSLIRSDFEMVDTWEYTDGMTVNVPITAMGGEDDISATIDQITAWGDVTAGSFSYHMFPGGHFTFFEDYEEDVLEIVNMSFE